MNKITIGVLAHVDAGKTTLSEALLYQTGAIRVRGRVDHGDAFLDTDAMERQRGITIFSKTARFGYADREYILLDTLFSNKSFNKVSLSLHCSKN